MSQYTPDLVLSVARALQTDDAEHYTADAAHMLEDYAATLRQDVRGPQFASADELAHWLESLHECDSNGSVGSRKWEAAQVAARAVRGMGSQAARVDDLMQLAREWCLSWGEWAHDNDPGCEKENAAEARLRAALEAALSAQPAERQGEDSLYVEARQCEDCDHLGINDCSDTSSACGDCEWQGPTPDEDKCPGCGHENCMAVACPECGGRYRFLADRRFTHPAAPVGVPDAPLSVFSKGGWTYSGTGQSFDEKAMDEAAFVAYRDYFAAAPSAPQGVE